ncbi:hypothetical protein [Roseibaca sp. Y0-43]|uniref:hypothetical protein n=1 Tax=Roseibaca sp. Y0-43 TaxID=2816854 RepID=UPI001D0C7892|nr:hypothetical protein [Roseibaca sp. Y0-43]MCC1480252.1 hypothetical protein [Roseibaca sp. Y0-43]
MIVLILGSGPNVVACRSWPRAPFDRIVTINNAWAVRPDWDYLAFPDDFPPERMPPLRQPGQQLVPSDAYVPENNRFGGIIYAGATMAFSAGYWALGALRPKVIAYLGCDMVYSVGASHFYGQGSPDPLRPDPTLQNLRAKSARLELIAARAGCAVVNLSTSESRLTCPRATPADVAKATPLPDVAPAMADVLAAERDLGAFCASGRYWQGAPLDAKALARIDALWLDAHHAARSAASPAFRQRRTVGP